MFEPGNYVAVKEGRRRSKWVKILECLDDSLLVVVNGSTFEIKRDDILRSTRTGRLRVRRACRVCGRPSGRREAHYCSLSCKKKGEGLDYISLLVFDAIVEYKRQNDGLSPTMRCLSAMANTSDVTALRAIKRLESAGRIRRVGAGAHGRIAVTGGKWTYDGT